MGTPRASKTSAAPQREVTALLPCLATLARCGRCDQRRAAGDVEGLRPTATGANAIDELRSFLFGEGHGHGVLAHHVDKAGKFRRLLAARGQHRQKGRGFHLRHVAGEDFLQHFGCLLARELRAVFGERAQQFLHQPLWLFNLLNPFMEGCGFMARFQEGLPSQQGWLHELARAEIHPDAEKLLQLGRSFDPQQLVEESTIDFLTELREQLNEHARIFNAYSENGSRFQDVKVYAVAQTAADFMLFRNQIKLIFSNSAHGVIQISFAQHVRGTLAVNGQDQMSSPPQAPTAQSQDFASSGGAVSRCLLDLPG